eukprot:CAMPEP_0194264576 /NCGR_PEP_ID=MMETSP0158-20130606/47659_1 /TAXON_ID=33649 /ORGANISM="Thalassionema nitzschioides, Strain L26-B" /LENGTH=335 /DNA_ID=CAMNT_0039004821 /DNA_START=414 /DNA_END=1418 /DNA_ORIENTATION=-
MTTGSNGFIRFKCSVGDLSVSLVELKDIPSAQIQESDTMLSAISVERHFQGMLCRNLERRGASNSELQYNQGVKGIQDITLGMLNMKLCTDIRTLSQTNLAPCLVRVIRGAKLLTISYCKVQVQCTRCFEPYVKRFKSNSPSCSPLDDLESSHRVFGVTLQPSRRLFKDLQCPNLCPTDFGEIKWECSGLLDDGTGQGKLYSERQASLLMLGISQKLKNLIEEGALQTDTGIIYQKAMPPSSLLQKTLKELSQFSGGGEMTEDELLQRLAPKARASFLLFTHCSNSPNTTRELDYFVRCKPISSEIYLNQTYVERSVPALKATQQAFQSETLTYS